MLLVPSLATSFCFFLLPLALFILARGPRTTVAWLWLAMAVVMVVLWRGLPVNLILRVTGGATLIFSGVVLLLTVAGVRSLVHRGMLAVLLTALALTGWLSHRGISYAEYRYTVQVEIWGTLRTGSPQLSLPETPPPSRGLLTGNRAPEETSDVQRYADKAATVAILLPGSMALLALLGLWLAWDTYQRITPQPIAPPRRPFHQFRFTDHFVWVLIILIALATQRTAAWLTMAGQNALLVTVALYALRGAAVGWSLLLVLAPFAQGLLLLMALLLFPPVFGGCVVIGVVDTWFDMRRRLPSQGVPQ